jgi:hypothetical protein
LKSPPETRRLLCWGGRAAAAEEVAGAPPVAGASRAPQGHLLENLGEVAGLQRGPLGVPGGPNGPKPAPMWAVGGSEISPRRVERGRWSGVKTDVFGGQWGACRSGDRADFSVVETKRTRNAQSRKEAAHRCSKLAAGAKQINNTAFNTLLDSVGPASAIPSPWPKRQKRGFRGALELVCTLEQLTTIL